MKIILPSLMRPALVALLAAAPLPLSAQGYEPPAADQTSPQSGETDGGESGSPDLGAALEKGLGSFFDDLLRDVEPQMEAIGRSLGAKVNEFAPVFDDIGAMMDDLGNYQAPERLANGDILIRRKPDAPPPPPLSEKFQELTRPSPDAAPEGNPDTLPVPVPTPLSEGQVEL